MNVFVTGGSGFVGSAVIPELVNAGHEVLALARSDGAAKKVKALGATALNGSLSDLDSLRKGAAQCDGILHLAYDNNMARALKAAKADRAAIAAMAEVIEGTDKPFVVTGGVTGIFGRGQAGSELETPQANAVMGTRLRAEKLLFSYTERGVRTMVIRLSPIVHGENDGGFTSLYVSYARKNNEANYVGDGANIWPAVHRLDAARQYRLALERGKAGAVYHAVAEGVPVRQVATVVGEKLSIPVRAVGMPGALRRMSWFAAIAAMNTPANSRWTREALNWAPEHPDLLGDLKQDHYY